MPAADFGSAGGIVSETFLVAWRRIADVPGDPLPWLLTVARNTIANHRRAARQRRSAEADLLTLARVARTAESVLVAARGVR